MQSFFIFAFLLFMVEIINLVKNKNKKLVAFKFFLVTILVTKRQLKENL